MFKRKFSKLQSREIQLYAQNAQSKVTLPLVKMKKKYHSYETFTLIHKKGKL